MTHLWDALTIALDSRLCHLAVVAGFCASIAWLVRRRFRAGGWGVAL